MADYDGDRPAANRTASKMSVDDAAILRLRATVLVDLDHQADDLDRADRRALEPLERVPNGAHVSVNLGRRALVMPSALHALRKAAGRLDVELHSADPDVVRRWHHAILTGELT